MDRWARIVTTIAGIIQNRTVGRQTQPYSTYRTHSRRSEWSSGGLSQQRWSAARWRKTMRWWQHHRPWWGRHWGHWLLDRWWWWVLVYMYTIALLRQRWSLSSPSSCLSSIIIMSLIIMSIIYHHHVYHHHHHVYHLSSSCISSSSSHTIPLIDDTASFLISSANFSRKELHVSAGTTLLNGLMAIRILPVEMR